MNNVFMSNVYCNTMHTDLLSFDVAVVVFGGFTVGCNKLQIGKAVSITKWDIIMHAKQCSLLLCHISCTVLENYFINQLKTYCFCEQFWLLDWQVWCCYHPDAKWRFTLRSHSPLDGGGGHFTTRGNWSNVVVVVVVVVVLFFLFFFGRLHISS